MEPQPRPLLLSMDAPDARRALASLQASGEVLDTVDAFEEILEDLFKIDFPFVAPGSPEFSATYASFVQRYTGGRPLDQCGTWAYFPWKRCLVHLPDKHDYYKLHTARNKFLVEPNEQDALHGALVGIAGLSIGLSVLNTLSLSGSCDMRLADFDTLSLTNLNRMLGSVCDLGRSKLASAARRAYELNPYANLELFPEGLTDENLDAYFAGNGRKLTAFVEETDGIRMKIFSRFKARELGIPVLMATDNGDNTILDIERFDLEPDRPLFHGAVSEYKLRSVNATLPLPEKVRIANAIVGPDVTPRMQRSLTMVGTRLPAWPQLGTAATLTGSAIVYALRRIVNGEDMPSGRYEVSLDASLDPNYMSEASVTYRKREKDLFIQGFELLYGKEEA